MKSVIKWSDITHRQLLVPVQCHYGWGWMRSSRFLDALPEGGEGLVSSTFAVNNPPFGLLLLRLMKTKYSLHVCCDPLRQVSVNHPGRTYHGHSRQLSAVNYLRTVGT